MLAPGLIEQTTDTIACDNAELFCACYQKGCVERAMKALEQVLQSEMMKRKQRGPSLAMKQPWQHPMSVYENFARSLPGFVSAEAPSSSSSSHRVPSHVSRTAEDQLFQHLIQLVDRGAAPLMQLLHSNSYFANVFSCFRSLREALLTAGQNSGETRVADLLNKTMESLVLISRALQGPSTPIESEAQQRVRECHLQVLRSVAESGLYPHHKVLLKCTDTLLKQITEGRLFSSTSGAQHLPLRALPLSYAQPSPFAEMLEALLRPGPTRLVNVIALDMELARLLEASLSQIRDADRETPFPVQAAYVLDALMQILKSYCFAYPLRESVSIPGLVSSLNEVLQLDQLV